MIFVFVADTNQAWPSCSTATWTMLEKSTLGAQFDALLPAVKDGKVNLEVTASPTWEHMDINFTK